eukprot:4714421-Pleurochrysis_carterae.AAC.1
MPARSLASAASTWPCALLTNRRPATLGMVAKPGVRIARLIDGAPRGSVDPRVACRGQVSASGVMPDLGFERPFEASSTGQ